MKYDMSIIPDRQLYFISEPFISHIATINELIIFGSFESFSSFWRDRWNGYSIQSTSFPIGCHQRPHVSIPIGPDCYYPYRYHLDSGSVHSLGMSHEDKVCEKDLRFWKSCETYRVPTNPEEEYTRPNFNIIMGLIVTLFNSRGRRSYMTVRKAPDKNAEIFFHLSSLVEAVSLSP